MTVRERSQQSNFQLWKRGVIGSYRDVGAVHALLWIVCAPVVWAFGPPEPGFGENESGR